MLNKAFFYLTRNLLSGYHQCNLINEILLASKTGILTKVVLNSEDKQGCSMPHKQKLMSDFFCSFFFYLTFQRSCTWSVTKFDCVCRDLSSNSLASLPSGVFHGLESLRSLWVKVWLEVLDVFWCINLSLSSPTLLVQRTCKAIVKHANTFRQHCPSSVKLVIVRVHVRVYDCIDAWVSVCMRACHEGGVSSTCVSNEVKLQLLFVFLWRSDCCNAFLQRFEWQQVVNNSQWFVYSNQGPRDSVSKSTCSNLHVFIFRHSHF